VFHGLPGLRKERLPMNHFVWEFSPVIEFLRFGPFAPRYYGLMFAIGFMVGYSFMQKIYRREGRNEEDLSSLLVHVMLGTILGARLGHCLFYEPEYYLSRPLEMLYIWRGGLASHGGTIGVILAVWLYKRKHPHQGYVWLADRLSIAIAFTAGCIRIGNFFNSEILGKPSDVPWAIIFAAAQDNTPRHPAMLYEAGSYLLLFTILLFLYYKTKAADVRGRMIGLMFVWIFTARFFIEFVKENQVEFEQGMLLNMGQMLSVPFVLLGLLAFTGVLIRWLPWLDTGGTIAPAPDALKRGK
jgi:phosphatidylglycerol:prolipoprotein diacylglycerol transferase